MPVPTGMRFRNACFTINNPPIDDNQPDQRQEPSWCPAKMRYLGYALERGTSGTVHWQIYVELRAQLTLQSLKVLLGNNPHIEGRKGTPQQARDYFAFPGEKPGETLKEAKEFGELSRQGKRSDLLEVVAAVKVSVDCFCFAEATSNWLEACEAYLVSRSAHEAYLDSLAYNVGRGNPARLGGMVSPSSDKVRSRHSTVEGRPLANPFSLHNKGSGIPLGPTWHRQVHQGDH